MSTITAPAFMRSTAARETMRGAGRPGIAAVVITASATAMLGLLFGREFARVAARAVGRYAGLDELGAQRFDLLAGGAAHVIGFDHGAQAARRGDRLQAGDANADDQHLRRTDGARRGGQHRQEAIYGIGGNEYRFVAADTGLRGQRIHRLRARDARHEFHGEAGDAAVAQRLDLGGARVRLHEADHHRAGLERADLRHAGRLHGQQDIRLRQHAGR
jgi:hypothetical protein